MFNQRLGVVASVAAALCLIHCNDDKGRKGAVVAKVPENVTSPDTALINLSAQINGMRARLRTRDDIHASKLLANKLRSRFTYLADLADIEGQVELAKLGKNYNDKHHLQLQFDVLMVLHRFSEARERLAAASKAGLDSSLVTESRQRLALSSGTASPAAIAKNRAKVVRQFPSFDAHVSYAIALALAGDFTAADLSFGEAVKLHADTSPLPLAWIAFQRGLMWCEMANKCDIAMPHYEQAVRLVPDYVVANVHLAELEKQAGKLQPAQARLRRLLRDDIDPEVPALLAEMLSEGPEKDMLLGQAKSAYAERLSKFRLAYADHGAEFFASQENGKAMALSLARDNFSNRKTDRAALLLLEIASAQNAKDEVCRVVSTIAGRGYPASNAILRDKLKQINDCPQ